MPSSVSIVVPVHNEAAYVEDLVPAMAAEVVDALGGPAQLIVVENGSRDDTAARAEVVCDRLRQAGWDARVVVHHEADYGAAVRTGMLLATGDWVVSFDIDYFAGEFVGRLAEAEADVVIASKRAPESRDRRSRFRRFATWVFNLILRFVLGSAVSDTHGIKAFRRQVIADLAPTVEHTEDLFDTELVLRAERAGLRILEVPIVVEERRAARSSLVKRVPRTLIGVFQLRRSLARDRRKTRSR